MQRGEKIYDPVREKLWGGNEFKKITFMKKNFFFAILRIKFDFLEESIGKFWFGLVFQSF